MNLENGRGFVITINIDLRHEQDLHYLSTDAMFQTMISFAGSSDPKITNHVENLMWLSITLLFIASATCSGRLIILINFILNNLTENCCSGETKFCLKKEERKRETKKNVHIIFITLYLTFLLVKFCILFYSGLYKKALVGLA